MDPLASAACYLVWSDSDAPGPPTRCYGVKRLAGRTRDDYLLVRIDPSLEGRLLGQRSGDIDLLVLAARHTGDSLFPITKWPLPVYVLRPLVEDPMELQELTVDEYEVFAWADLYPTEEAAGAHRAM